MHCIGRYIGHISSRVEPVLDKAVVIDVRGVADLGVGPDDGVGPQYQCRKGAAPHDDAGNRFSEELTVSDTCHYEKGFIVLERRDCARLYTFPAEPATGFAVCSQVRYEHQGTANLF